MHGVPTSYIIASHKVYLSIQISSAHFLCSLSTSTMVSVKSPISSPPHEVSPAESSPTPQSARNQSTAISAALAAALDATRVHQTLFPGLATLFFEGSSSIASKYSSLADSIEDAQNLLPAPEAVQIAALKSINDFPPYVTMNIRDSAPQLTLEDPSSTNEKDSTTNGIDFSKTIRRFLVRGGMRGYRMSRASHGVSDGCYYYEAIVLGDKTGKKRPREDDDKASEDLKTINSSANQMADTGHLRIGWSTRLGDLQAPVGYDKYSYAVRDIIGSRIHNSRREDKWGGQGFGPGDVIGFVIHLCGKLDAPSESTANEHKEKPLQQTNHILVYKNGVLMGNHGVKTAFQDISLDTYFPAVSCYLDGAVQLNFGPSFVYPPAAQPNDQVPKPLSEACLTPPTPEEAEETIISSSKEGRKIFLSKRTDEEIVRKFKELVRTEAKVRVEAYQRHLLMHKIEILGLRNERSLPTSDLFSH